MPLLHLLLALTPVAVACLAACAVAGGAGGGEVPPAESLPCFPGAIYRKAVSSDDVWTGIEGVVTLPSTTFDPARRSPRTGQPLDNPSIYLGGRAGGREVDAGVSWEVVREPDGTVSEARKAFRPFWRVETWTSGPAEPRFYYYPGDTIRMTVRTVEADRLVLEVALLHRAGTPAVDPATAEPVSVLRAAFDAPGFGPGKVQSFKRVNAIDQSGNEGRPARETATTVSAAAWHRAHLLRGDERLAFTPKRFTDMRCPDPQLVKVSANNAAADGGETVELGRR